MKIKSVIFDIEDTLFDYSLQIRMTRLNALRAMIEAGLPIDLESGYNKLKDIVDEYGSHYPRHFDKLLELLGLKWNPAVIAAGVVAYRETSDAYLKPFPETVPVLIKLRDLGYKIAVVSEGRSVKQWQKLIQLGIHHLFHKVLISEDYGTEYIDKEFFRKCFGELKVKPEEVLYVCSNFKKGIYLGNKSRTNTVRIKKGDLALEKPKLSEEKAKYEIETLSSIITILESLSISTN